MVGRIDLTSSPPGFSWIYCNEKYNSDENFYVEKLLYKTDSVNYLVGLANSYGECQEIALFKIDLSSSTNKPY